MTKNLIPVSIAGIEFDALIKSEESYEQEIPDYPTEEGFSVSDTIILKPIMISLELYISNTPVTWSRRHSISPYRVNAVCDRLKQLYFSKQLVKVVTPDAIYTNMGMTSMQISKSKEHSTTRRVTLNLKKVYDTKRKTVYIPSYILKSGETAVNAGKATTSSSANSSSMGGSTNVSNESGGGSSGSNSSSASEAKKAGSILYGVASGLGFL